MDEHHKDHSPARPTAPKAATPQEKLEAVRLKLAASLAVLEAMFPRPAEDDAEVPAIRRDGPDMAHLAYAAWASRQTRAEAEKARFRRTTIIVLHGATVVASFGPTAETGTAPRVAEGLKMLPTLDDVLEELEARGLNYRDHDLRTYKHQAARFAPRDLTIWRDDRLLAVVRTADDGDIAITYLDH